jgi:eukaryotic-like serine/threonine-protein kinase
MVNLDEIILGEKIGEGKAPNAAVYHGTDPVRGSVAVKVFTKSLLFNLAQWDEHKKIILNEGQRLHESEHRNVVRIYSVQDKLETSQVHLVMEYLSKGSVADEYLKGPLRLSIVKRILTDVAMGLEFMHNRGIYHRDIKPDNILIGNDGAYKIGDFGFATNDIVNGFAQARGYQRHYAPEVVERKVMDARAEVWSLGLTAYRLLHGDLVYRGIGMDERRAVNFTTSLKFLPHIPDDWRRFIKRALHFEPDKRHQNVSEFLNGLGSLNKDIDWLCTFTPQYIAWERKKGNYIIRIEWDKTNLPNTTWIANVISQDGLKKRKIKGSLNAIMHNEANQELEDFFTLQQIKG